MNILKRTKPITTRKEYLELAKLHHPDNGGSTAAFDHVQKLWKDPKSISHPHSVTIDNIVYRYDTVHNGIYTGRTSILFHPLPRPFKPLKYSFPDTKVQLEMMKYLPVFVREGKDYVIVGKSQNLFHLPAHLSKIVGTAHASWIISSLYNLLCYLEWAGLTHNDIQVDNIWIDPVQHSAHLLGGWWFAAPVSSRLTHLPQSSLPAPRDKLASPVVDLRLIKQLGLQLIGDRTGMTLPRSPKVDFLRAPTTGSAVKDYGLWIKCLGERKFVELKL